MVIGESFGREMSARLRGGTWMAALLALAAATYTAWADPSVWWVSDAGGADADGRGSEASPFKTIQFAVDRAASGDTVKVMPGTYATGGMALRWNGSTLHSNRVAIIAKSIRLVSTGGREVTHIVGAADPNPTAGNAYGLGDAAVRCVCVSGEGTAGTVVEGFTLRDGRGDWAGGRHSGGGFAVYSGAANAYLVDCAVSNCFANVGGGVYAGTAIRCHITGCRCPPTGGQHVNGGAVYGSRLWNCLVEANPVPGGVNAVVNCVLVNCTVALNGGYAGVGADCSLYSCIVVGNGRALDSNNFASSSVKANAVANGCVIDAAKPNVAPALGDWRVVKGGPADGTADPKWLTNGTIALPEGTEITDFAGNAIDVGRSVCAGCVQEAADVKGGVLLRMAKATDWSLWCGKMIPVSGAYAYATSERPVQWKVHLRHTYTDGDAMYYLGGIDRVGGDCAFPRIDGSAILMPPPTAGHLVTNTANYWSGCWVKADAAEGGDGSEGHPFRTIQEAVAGGRSSVVVNVLAGEYSTGVTESSGAPHYGRSRLSVTGNRVRVVALDGPDRTFLLGEPDPATEGLGPGAVRCVNVSGTDVAVQGFTLAQGHTAADGGQSGQGAAMRGGGILADCVVTNCHAYGYAVYQSHLRRCRVDCCTSADSSLVGGSAVSCWLGAGNRSRSSDYYGYFASGSRALNCTIVGDGTRSLFSQTLTLYDSVVVGGDRYKAAMKQKGCVVWETKNIEHAASSYTNADPLLGPSMVYPYTSMSPVFGAGAVCSPDDWALDSYTSNCWRYACGDIDGNPIVYDAEGHATAGCAMTVDPHVRVDDADGVLALTGGTVGLNKLTGDDSLSIDLADGVKRPCRGYSLNGTEVCFDDATPITAETMLVAGGLTIKPVMTTDFYVDATGGNDADSGFTPKRAKRTLRAVMEDTSVTRGDTVHALPGRYDDGTMMRNGSTPAEDVPSRVVVPSGVTLKSTRGAAATMIVGAASADGHDDVPGCGEGAVRCVLLDGRDTSAKSRVEGFTLRGGYTLYPPSVADGHYDRRYSAGGVHGVGDYYIKNAEAVDCVIENCGGWRGGALRYVNAIRCVIRNNRSHWGGSAAAECRLNGCLTYGNTDSEEDASRPGEKAVFTTYSVCDTTVADGVSGTKAAAGAVEPAGTLRNTLVLGWAGEDLAGKCFRCALVAEKCLATDVSGDGTFTAPATELAVDADYRPIGGWNRACDAANPDYTAAVPGLAGLTTDLTGFPRVTNGTRSDIGALEGDWRVRYASDLGRRLKVASASPAVVESPSRSVVLADGTALTASYAGDGRSHRYLLRFMVAGDGALTVTANGVPQVYGPSSEMYSVSFENALDCDVSFAYAGDGYAELIGASRIDGMVVTVR